MNMVLLYSCGNVCDRSSYPDADESAQGDGSESVDPEVFVSSGFELVLPSGKHM